MDEDTAMAAKCGAEDTDAIDDEALAKIEEKQQADSKSMWLRIFGCVVLAVAVGLIIFGLASHAGVADDKIRRNKSPVAVTQLAIKPRDETRTFEFATLPNGLQVVTVQDKRALKKGFATAVQAGSFDDPEKLKGLAHFCEHMLFLGTKKYSDPSGFDNFVAAHGGWNNAYTASEVTVYFATVSEDAAKEGFDRFADFFNAPLFDETYVEKEVHAIDSEHTKNVQNPSRQILQVLYSLAAKKSPVSWFHTGNLKTLMAEPERKHIDPVKELKEYWKTHYCPDRMKIVTVGSESNAEQLKLIRKEFGSLEPKSDECKKPRPSWSMPNPWPSETLGKWVNVQGMLPRSFIWLMFPMPDVSKMYASEPLDYIEYVLAYGGENSLSRVLKDSLGLAAGFEVMFDTTSAGTTMFMTVQLTKQGREYKALVLDVIFSYLAVLRRGGVREDLYDSLASVQKLKWDWGGQTGPVDTASDLAERMTRVKPQDLLWADSVIENPNPQLVHDLLLKLVPTNMNIAFVKEKRTSDQRGKENVFFQKQKVETLEHYDIEYSVQDIDSVPDLEPGTRDKWSNWIIGRVTATNIEQSISEFIAKNGVHVLEHRVPVPKCPEKIVGIPHALTFEYMRAAFEPYSKNATIDSLLYGPTPGALDLRTTSSSPFGVNPEVWYRRGWMVASPKIQVMLTLRPLKTAKEPELPVLNDLELELYGRLLGDEMSPKLVDLTVTGMSYEIEVGGGGLEFTFVGFRPSMHRLITSVVKEFNQFNDKPSLTPDMRWNKARHALREDLITYADLPLNYAVSDRNLLLTKGARSREELLHELDKNEVTKESASRSVQKLLLSRQLKLTSLAMGNMAEDDAGSIIGDFLHSIDYPKRVERAPPDAEVERVSPIVSLPGPVEVRRRNPKNGDADDVVVVSVVHGVSTVESRVTLGLLSQLFRPLAYNELRTNQQLGYIVSAGVVLLSNVQLMSCVVQGSKLDADHMEAAVHYVLTELMPKRLKELTKEEFNAYKSSFRQDLLQPPLTMDGEFDHFAGAVDQGGIGFTLQNEMLRYLDGPAVTRESLKKVWADLILPEDSSLRKIISVKYFAKDVVPDLPSLEKASAIWASAKVPDKARKLMAREYSETVRLKKADSEERNKLAAAGNWYEKKQYCKLKDESTASKAPLKVPQQIKDIVQRRKEDIEAFENTPVVYTTTNLTRNSLKWRGSHSQSRLRSFSLAPGSS